MSIGIVLKWEDKGENQVDHVEDGQHSQVPIGGGAHTASGHDHYCDAIAHNTDRHYDRHQYPLDPKTNSISK